MSDQRLLMRLRWTATWTGVIPLAVTLLGGLLAGSWASWFVVGLVWFGCAFTIGTLWTWLDRRPPEPVAKYESAWQSIWNGEGLARAGHTVTSAMLFVLWMAVNWVFLMLVVRDMPHPSIPTAAQVLRYVVGGTLVGVCVLAVRIIAGRPELNRPGRAVHPSK